MLQSISRAIARFTAGADEQRDFDLAARRIQQALLEISPPKLSGFEIGVHAEPARLVGGDYIDLFVEKAGCLVFGLGDASGKSLAAALNALMLRYLVRGLVRALGPSELVQIVTHTNAVLYDDLSDGDFITFLLGYLDQETGRVRIVNAGHEPPLVLAADSPTVRTLDTHDIVLGVKADPRYVEDGCVMAPGDTIVIYTDGLTEATNKKGEMFTIEGLKEELRKHRGLTAAALAEAMFEGVKTYSSVALRDDATIFVLRRSPLGAAGDSP